MKIGVISDTHNFLDPKIQELFSGVDHILHAGDIGQPWIIQQLRLIAPVTAVTGNNDPGLPYNETEVIELAQRRILVHHIVDVNRPSETVRRLLRDERPDIVVFGHSHKAFEGMIEGALFFNPGYAGKPRFGDPRSVALLHIEDSGVRAQFLNLPG